MIYVWAKNQANGSKSSYLRQNKRNNRPDDADADGKSVAASADLQFCDGLPIHTNRTQFTHSDMLVPWKRKDGGGGDGKKTFLRFYHVFDEGELQQLCEKVSGIDVIESYYDQGNWCVIFEKK